VRDEHELILTLGTISEKASPYVLLVHKGISQEHEAEFKTATTPTMFWP
jgi:hypothetical protein